MQNGRVAGTLVGVPGLLAQPQQAQARHAAAQALTRPHEKRGGEGALGARRAPQHHEQMRFP